MKTLIAPSSAATIFIAVAIVLPLSPITAGALLFGYAIVKVGEQYARRGRKQI